MERTALIVALRSISPAMAPENRGTCYWIEASDGSREYWVTLDPRGYPGDRCTCRDYEQRGGPCKHSIAARLLEACERAQRRKLARRALDQARPAAPSHVVPFPARHYSPEERFELTPTGEAYCAGLLGEQPEPSA